MIRTQRATRFLPRATVALGIAAALTSGAQATVNFDQDVTPDVIFGSGNANGSFTVSNTNGGGQGLELGLRAKLRFDASNAPQNIFNSDGAGTYTFDAGVPPTGFTFAPNSPTTPVWNFEWSINTAALSPDATSTLQLNDFTYELRLDGDPSAATDFLAFDPINTVDPADHAIGNNTTGNGGGTSSPPNYFTLIDTENVAQNSWSYEFFNLPTTALENFDPNTPGVYTIELEAFSGATSAGLVSIDVVVVPEPAALTLTCLGIVGGVAGRRRR